MELSGKWIGEFVNRLNKTIPFVLEMTCSEGYINGLCVDENSSFDGPATIEGFFDVDTISFIKKYPCSWKYDESGHMQLFPHLPSPSIHYYGRIKKNELQDIFSGEWEMFAPCRDKDGNLIPSAVVGNWTMSKHDAQ